MQVVRLIRDNNRFLTVSDVVDKSKPVMFVVVASQDDTVITMESPDGSLTTETLSNGQTYTRATSTMGESMDGYVITSDKPIAVFSGNQDNLAGNRFGDSQYISLPPTSMLRDVFFIPPVAERQDPSLYRIRIVSDQSATVTDYGGANVIADLGRRSAFSTTLGSYPQGTALRCSTPCLVVQQSTGEISFKADLEEFFRLIPAVNSYCRYCKFWFGNSN